ILRGCRPWRLPARPSAWRWGWRRCPRHCRRRESEPPPRAAGAAAPPACATRWERPGGRPTLAPKTAPAAWAERSLPDQVRIRPRVGFGDLRELQDFRPAVFGDDNCPHCPDLRRCGFRNVEEREAG